MINGLSISGNSFVPQEIIKNLVPDSLFKKEKGRIKLNDIKLLLEEYPYVYKADVMFGSDDSIDIELSLREPIAQLADSSGKLWLSDKEGRILPDLFFENFSHLPIVVNSFKTSDMEYIDDKYFIELIEKLEDDYPVVRGVLSQVVFEGRTVELVLKRTGTRVFIGDTSHLDDKLNYLSDFLNDYLRQTDEKNIESIDLRWSKQVVIKKE